MKSLIFAFVVAFILQDYGTLQVKPVSECNDIELMEMFRKYSLASVDAAMKPLRRNNVLALPEGGDQCLSGINMYTEGTLYDAILATTSIAKDHFGELKLIQATPQQELSGIESRIGNGMMNNIRVILIALQTSSAQLTTFMGLCRKYLLAPNRGAGASSSSAGSSHSGRSLSTQLKCYRTLVGLNKNNGFVAELARAFGLVRELINHDSDASDRRWRQTVDVIKVVARYQFRTPSTKTKRDLKKFLKKLEASRLEEEEDSDSD